MPFAQSLSADEASNLPFDIDPPGRQGERGHGAVHLTLFANRLQLGMQSRGE